MLIFIATEYFGGSITPETVIKIQDCQPELKNLVPNIERLWEIMTFKDDDGQYNFQRFLQKFHVLNHIRWDEHSIDIACEQVVCSLRDEGIDYSEIRFSIDKYLNYINWDEVEACLFFLHRLYHWGDTYNVKVGPILCIKHETPKKQALRLSKIINHWRIKDLLAGIDFVSDEAFFDSKYVRQITRWWRMMGKGVLIHVGETQSAENVKKAIEMGVDRIAHGITAANDPEILKMANDHGVVFDISLSSNLMTGVVTDLSKHPVKKMLEHGCTITIGTDDPVTFQTTLENEYNLLQNSVGISEEEILKIKRNSGKVALIDRIPHYRKF